MAFFKNKVKDKAKDKTEDKIKGKIEDKTKDKKKNKAEGKMRDKAGPIRNFWSQRIVLGSLKSLRRFAHRQIRLRDDTFGLHQDWKVGIQEDFNSWLMDISDPTDIMPEDTGADPSTMPDQEEGKPKTTLKDFNGSNHVPRQEDHPKMDLFTLFSEFASLRKEIGLQSREQARNVKSLKEFNGFVDKTGHMLDMMNEKIARMDAMEIEVQDRVEEKTIRQFLDLRNNLQRGRDAAQKVLNGRFVWRRQRLTSLAKGYEIALNKFDKALAMADTYPVVTLGEPFDPTLMRAVDRVTVRGIDAGMVHAEVACGFVRKKRAILPADVIVTK
jgi:molecular chaperone GrpE (heat shock protein)